MCWATSVFYGSVTLLRSCCPSWKSSSICISCWPAFEHQRGSVLTRQLSFQSVSPPGSNAGRTGFHIRAERAITQLTYSVTFFDCTLSATVLSTSR
ncbi:hypothetical protein T4C_4404 [Trichinella pseudospiralis]|uniref:Uncharacterized protein n=1 Tax=Trichinella pseudospiralis TaxID=6337 RepID=A0A0V1ICM0_TRIPS|nr:hypothetical protein T4C_10288 [Trichinella pseudospiralis]KRZ20783.1 hypothetical protein T4C_4404 [Trichinella pseudospiralis]